MIRPKIIQTNKIFNQAFKREIQISITMWMKGKKGKLLSSVNKNIYGAIYWLKLSWRWYYRPGTRWRWWLPTQMKVETIATCTTGVQRRGRRRQQISEGEDERQISKRWKISHWKRRDGKNRRSTDMKNSTDANTSHRKCSVDECIINMIKKNCGASIHRTIIKSLLVRVLNQQKRPFIITEVEGTMRRTAHHQMKNQGYAGI